MFLKVLVFFTFLKLSLGSSECNDATVRVKTLKEQCPNHDGFYDSDAPEKQHNANEKIGSDLFIYDSQKKEESVPVKPNTRNFKNNNERILEEVDRKFSIENTYQQQNELFTTTEEYGTMNENIESVGGSFINESSETKSEVVYENVTQEITGGVEEHYLEKSELLKHLDLNSGVGGTPDDSAPEELDSLQVADVDPDNAPHFAKRVSHYGDFNLNSDKDSTTNCEDCDLRLLPVHATESQETRFNKKESAALPTATIQFSEIPEGDKLLIESFGLTEGFFVFSYLGEFISYLQPNEFPVGLLQAALQNQITLVSLIAESLQLEVGFVMVLVMGIILALAGPCVVLSHTCYRMRSSKQTKRPPETSDMVDNEDIVIGWAGNCRRRTLVFVLQLLLLLLIAGMLVMFVTNEQLSSAMDQSSKVLLTAMGDLKTFLHNSHLQLHFVMTRSMDQAVQACIADLENIGTLLGRPIQEELVLETGLDVTMATLDELSEETAVASKLVEAVMTDAKALQEGLITSRDKLAELRQQVDMFRRQCPPRDRALCDTINASGLDVNLRLDRVRGDERLNRIRQLKGTDLSTAVQDSRNHFDSVPLKIEDDTRDSRQVVRRQLSRQRSILDEDVSTLEMFTRKVATKVNDAKTHLADWLHHLDEVEFWRWVVSGSAAVSVLVIWILLLSGISCGCCGSEKSVGPTLLGSIVLICLVSTVLWAIALVGFLIGGHGEVFVCRPLYDSPQYSALSRLLDEPGVFHKDSKHGFFSNVIYGNDSFDVSIKDILRDCQENKPAYQTFHLQRVFDVDSASDSRKWDGLRQSMDDIRVDLSHLQLLTPTLNSMLHDLLEDLGVNFTVLRTQLSGAVTGKDLNSFATQLDSVANQIRDSATASRMEALASRTRRLIKSDIQLLEEKRDILVYQLTALEVQVTPLERKVNQSLTQLKTIQFFINTRGGEIGNKKTREYVERLDNYINQFREHVLQMAQERVAPCKPIWTIFHSTRLLFCKHIMDPLNGFWFATIWCLVIFLIATPVCLKLVDYYRLKGNCNSRSSGSPSESLMIAEHGRGWSTPGDTGEASTW